MTDLDQLTQMSKISIAGVNKSSLIDISEVQVDSSLPIEARVKQYLEQIKNPYCFLCGNTPVQVSFKEDGRELDSAVFSYLQGIKNR